MNHYFDCSPPPAGVPNRTLWTSDKHQQAIALYPRFCMHKSTVCMHLYPSIHSFIYLSIYLFHWNSLVQIMSMFPLRDAIISLNVHIFVHLGRRHCSSIELPVTLFAGASGVHFHARLCRRHDSRSAVDGICVS